MWSAASRRYTPSVMVAKAFFGRKLNRLDERLLEQHQIGQGANAAGHGRNSSGNFLRRGEIDIADDPAATVGILVDANVNERRTRLDHLAGYHARPPGCGHKNIGLAGEGSEIGSARVTDGDSSMLLQEHQRQRLANYVAARDHYGSPAIKRSMSALKDLHHRRSRGKPLALMLLQKHATVTICHSRTADLASFTRQADILVAAAGRARMITGEMIKPGATLIDVGINEDPDGSGGIVGDVDFASAQEVAGAITPVPGGVGPLTNLVLLKQSFI